MDGELVIPSGLSGYFDDAGKIHDQPSLVIGGFIGRKEQWESLRSDWEDLLLRHDIKYFHGVDCEHGNREFDKSKGRWKHPQARSKCRMEFVEAIVNAGLTGFVSGLVSADYRALDKAARTRIGKPFSLVAQTLIVIVKDWANACHVHELISYLFEAGSEGYGEFSDAFSTAKAHEIKGNAYRMKSCSLVGKDCIPVQTADLIAYEYSHCMGSIATANDLGFRRPAVHELKGRLRIETRYHDSKTLAEMLAQPKSEYRQFRVSQRRRGQ